MYKGSLFFLAAAILLACSCRQAHSPTENHAPAPAPGSADSAYSIQVFKSPGREGFGYAISLNGTKIIQQPNIPAIQHNHSFSTAAEAGLVAGLVRQKLEAHIFLPTITLHELDSMQIHY
jgi:Domain of unknown function (DUF4907)